MKYSWLTILILKKSTQNCIEYLHVSTTMWNSWFLFHSLLAIDSEICILRTRDASCMTVPHTSDTLRNAVWQPEIPLQPASLCIKKWGSVLSCWPNRNYPFRVLSSHSSSWGGVWFRGHLHLTCLKAHLTTFWNEVSWSTSFSLSLCFAKDWSAYWLLFFAVMTTVL